MKPESRFRVSVRKFLNELPDTVILPIQQVALRGHPDFVLCVVGLFVALELKTDTGKLSALQEHLLEKIAETGGMSIVARPSNWDEIKELLIRIARGDH